MTGFGLCPFRVDGVKRMRNEQTAKLSHTRETAIRLIKCMGMTAALAYCKDSQWMGIANEIRKIRKERTMQ